MTKIFDDYFRILVTLWCHQNQEIVTFFLKSLVLRRNNTIEDPEFKQALSDLNPDVIYEKLKVICKRNAKRQTKWRYPSLAELPVDIFYDSDKLMRTISLFFMDNKMDNYKEPFFNSSPTHLYTYAFLNIERLTLTIKCTLWI